VYVDPTTTWVNAGSNSYGDAHIASGYPNTAFPDYVRPDSPYYHELWNGTDPSGTSGTSYDYLRWDLGSIAGMTIDSATFKFDPYHQYYNAPTAETTYARRVTASWTESTVTYNSRPGATTAGTVTVGCVEATWCEFDVTTFVRYWVYGTYTNYGFQLDTIGKGSTYWKRIIASEQGSGSVPKLTVTYHNPDTTPPSVTGFTGPASPTKLSTLSYSLSFSESVTGLAPSDFTIGGSASGWSVNSVSGSGAGPYTVTLGGGGEGTVSLTLNVNTFQDGALNNGPAAAVPAPTVTVDRTPPSVTGFTAPASPTGATALSYSLSFGESVSGLATSDFTIGGSASGWSVSYVSGSGAGPYTVVLGGGGEGTVSLTLSANTVQDAATNDGPTAAVPAPTVTVDRTAPSVTGFTGPASPTGMTTLSYTLSFGETVTGLATSDFSVGGTSSGWFVSSVGTPSGLTYPVTVTGANPTPGTVILTLGASTVEDGSHNQGPASAVSAPSVIYDPSPPSASAVYPAGGPTSSQALTWSYSNGGGPQARYWVDLATDAGFGSIIASSGDTAGSATSYAIPTTVTPGATYYWRVKASNGTSWSPWSTTASFTYDLGNLGYQSQHASEDFAIGGDGASVNVSTGNLAISHTLLSLPIRGSSVTVGMTYNSQDPADVGLGTGWRLDAFRRLLTNADGSVTLTDADGAAGNNPTSYADPSGRETLTFGSLNAREIEFCVNHPLECISVRRAAAWAQHETRRRFTKNQGLDGHIGNAFQHCLWAGSCATMIGKTMAIDITNRHEWPLVTSDTVMDLWNNRVGVGLSGYALIWRTEPHPVAHRERGKEADELMKMSNLCYWAAHSGLLMILRR
jgi:hypothetical protein